MHSTRYRQAGAARGAAIATAIALACVALAALWLAPERSARQRSASLAPQELTVAAMMIPSASLIHIAEANGYFRDEALTLSYRPFQLGRDALASAISGESDLATVFETPVVTQIYAGSDLAIVSTLHSSTRSHGLIARRDRGIARASDLKGRRIGVTPGTSNDYLLSLLLASAAIPAASVTRVPVAPAQYRSALVGGEVDALVAFDPFLQDIASELGEARSVVFFSDVYIAMSMLAGRRDTVERKAEAIRRLLAALVRAEDFIKRHPEESFRIVAGRLSESYSEQAVRQAWGSMKFEARLDNLLLTLLTQQGQWMRDTGRVATPVPDFGHALATAHLAAVSPLAVTVLTPAQ